MKKTTLLGATALNTLALVGASFAFSSAASAQTATPTDTTAPTTQMARPGTSPRTRNAPPEEGRFEV